MSAQLDLFDIKPVPNVPRVLITPQEAAIEALNRTGAYIDSSGRIVLAMPAKWVKTAPDRQGMWLATRGPYSPVTAHRVVKAFGKLNVLGLYFQSGDSGIEQQRPMKPKALGAYAEAKSEGELIELMNLWWIGPFPFPPD